MEEGGLFGEMVEGFGVVVEMVGEGGRGIEEVR